MIEYLVSYSNGYSPIYFTNKFNQFLKGTNESAFFLLTKQQ